MVVVLLPEVHGPGFSKKPWLPVLGFLRERRVFWVPAAPASDSSAARFLPDTIWPDGGQATVLQVGEGLQAHRTSSGPGDGEPSALDHDPCQHHGGGVGAGNPGGLASGCPSLHLPGKRDFPAPGDP